jgi:hypothetical protein
MNLNPICPIGSCGGALRISHEIEEDAVVCSNGHRFEPGAPLPHVQIKSLDNVYRHFEGPEPSVSLRLTPKAPGRSVLFNQRSSRPKLKPEARHMIKGKE